HAYGSVLERGRYPRGAVYLELPFELVDVNVHPQKAEVRFADPRAVGDALYGILSRALAGAFSLPPRRPAARPPTPNPAATAARLPGAVAPLAEPSTRAADWMEALSAAASTASALEHPSAASPGSAANAPSSAASADAHSFSSAGAKSGPSPSESAVSRAAEPPPAVLAFRDSSSARIRPSENVTWASLRFVAQLRQTYLLCEGTDGLYLLDQHAAAERVTFTRLRRDYQARAVPSQSLLFPAMVEVTASEAELIEARAKEFAEVGMDVRVRGPESVSVHTVPKLLARSSPERMLRDLLTEVTRKGERAFSDAVDLALATMACHGSVRAGDTLAESEVSALLVALDDADFAGHCPHGRPVVTFIAWAELERKVGRR
ncbi:MAG TPA: DNA mismatch repair protein MutL, partial [Polyangiaceae bacterium]|nr:DNA mismatch repair protein MutL [Polyangiaceae bacterium]